MGKVLKLTTGEFVNAFADFIVEHHFVDDVPVAKRKESALIVANQLYTNIINIEGQNLSGVRKFTAVFNAVTPTVRKLGTHILRSALPFLVQLAVVAIYHTSFVQQSKYLPLLDEFLKKLGILPASPVKVTKAVDVLKPSDVEITVAPKE